MPAGVWRVPTQADACRRVPSQSDARQHVPTQTDASSRSRGLTRARRVLTQADMGAWYGLTCASLQDDSSAPAKTEAETNELLKAMGVEPSKDSGERLVRNPGVCWLA